MASAALETTHFDPSGSIDFRSSTRAFLLKSGTGWFLIAALIASLGWAAVIILPMLAIKALTNRTNHYSLEGDRLFMRRGILIRSEEEIELYRIKDIKATFSVIQQMFGNGNIEILSSDETDSTAGRRMSFAIGNVKDARNIREELRSRVEAARKLRGVREYDVA